MNRNYHTIKRVIDIALCLLAAPVLLVFGLVVALAISLDSAGPVLFVQRRVGKGSRPFHLLKFRTMFHNVDDHAHREYMKAYVNGEVVVTRPDQETFKPHEEAQVTRVGRFLRKTSLDELPQLLNVLKGEMSLSGPRAYMPAELGSMGTYTATILRVNPGITGWWQVLGRHNTSFQQRLEMDEYYISNWSLWMDLYIFLKTVLVVLGGSGA